MFPDSLEVRWERAREEELLSNCFSHYVVRQLTISYPGNIFFIFMWAIDSIYIWLFISFSICNRKDTILEGVVLTSDLAIDSSWCLMCCLGGLLEPVLSFVLIKCKHMTFPDLVVEPPQMECMEPAIVKEEKQGQFWLPLTASIWQPFSSLDGPGIWSTEVHLSESNSQIYHKIVLCSWVGGVWITYIYIKA